MQSNHQNKKQEIAPYWYQEQNHMISYLTQSDTLLQEVKALDAHVVQQAIHHCLHIETQIPTKYKPAPYWPLQASTVEQQTYYKQASQVGLELIQQGKVAAFTVAGGQGTRLGYDGPKGTLGVSPIAQKSLFQIFAEQIYAWTQKSKRSIAWYIMCSPLNIKATKSFFVDHHYFGLASEDVYFFTQGVLPAFDTAGKVLLKDRDHLALSPNGHGGSFKALIDAQAIQDMQERDIEHISYFQVDNPLVHIFDPLFIGLHHLENSDMSSRSLSKTNALEKLGNFVTTDGALHIIEYSDLPNKYAHQREADGHLSYRAGSPAIHMIRRDFIAKFESQDLQLPYHKAVKKVPYLNAQGTIIYPETANALKAETFVFDALPLANNPLILEASRSEQFSPVKNKTGVDSLEQSQIDQNTRAHDWLASLGYHIPDTCCIEISPRSFPQREDLKNATIPDFIAGQHYYLENE